MREYSTKRFEDGPLTRERHCISCIVGTLRTLSLYLQLRQKSAGPASAIGSFFTGFFTSPLTVEKCARSASASSIRIDASVIRLELFVLGRQFGWIIQPAYNIIERLPHLTTINNLYFRLSACHFRNIVSGALDDLISGVSLALLVP